jgi:hypothetical protein
VRLKMPLRSADSWGRPFLLIQARCQSSAARAGLHVAMEAGLAVQGRCYQWGEWGSHGDRAAGRSSQRANRRGATLTQSANSAVFAYGQYATRVLHTFGSYLLVARCDRGRFTNPATRANELLRKDRILPSCWYKGRDEVAIDAKPPGCSLNEVLPDWQIGHNSFWLGRAGGMTRCVLCGFPESS